MMMDIISRLNALIDNMKEYKDRQESKGGTCICITFEAIDEILELLREANDTLFEMMHDDLKRVGHRYSIKEIRAAVKQECDEEYDDADKYYEVIGIVISALNNYQEE